MTRHRDRWLRELETRGPAEFFRFWREECGGLPEGVVAMGGRLEPDWLLYAYRHGIFPWPHGEQLPLLWFSPDPRAVVELDQFHVPRRLRRTLRKHPYQLSCDRDFAGVIRGCATAQDRRGKTWITPQMITAYCRLHQLGFAHSVEAWHDGLLAGGVYGVAIGGAFSAESMFYRMTDASKVALVHLVGHLRVRGYRLLDVQQYTPVAAQFGAVEVPRDEFLHRLAHAVSLPVTFGCCLEHHWDVCR